MGKMKWRFLLARIATLPLNPRRKNPCVQGLRLSPFDEGCRLLCSYKGHNFSYKAHIFPYKAHNFSHLTNTAAGKASGQRLQGEGNVNEPLTSNGVRHSVIQKPLHAKHRAYRPQ
jgi:hypothetical protein